MAEQKEIIHTEITPLLEILKGTGNKYDLEKIGRAFSYAEELHDGQFRKSGAPYISHPIAVAEIVASFGLDTDSICAALLHDAVEDCAERTSIEEMKKRFGKEVAALVDGLTKIQPMDMTDKEEAHIETVRKMLLAMSKDIRVIVIKLCDRLHNIRTLYARSEKGQRATAFETMQIYAPLAHRLGLQKIKKELENYSIRYLDPIGYAEVEQDIDSRYGQNRDLIEHVKEEMLKRFAEYNIKCTIEGRVKSIYSVYKKMYNGKKNFDEIYDFYALRVIVDTEIECYTVLGIVHEMYRSIPGRFKDYISTPKANMYQSIHTSVIGREGVPFEVQIRTWDMHRVADYGIAAHWKYKTGSRENNENSDKKLAWISSLIETEDSDPEELIQALKSDIYQEEIYIFTPKGDVITLPQGSTVIDFAYSIHSAVGNRMIGAKINGQIVPIDTIPRNGEIIEILTSPNMKGPSRDWLSIVKTSEARNKIRQWFKKEKRAENIEFGKSAVESELRRYGRSVSAAVRDEIAAEVAGRIGMVSVDDLYNAIGYGGTSISRISTRLKDEYDRRVKPEDTPEKKAELLLSSTHKKKHAKPTGGIIVDGDVDCQVKFAKCCNPLPGDDVVGFITKGYGISIHKCDCPNVLSSRKNPEHRDRFVSAAWDLPTTQRTADGGYEALMTIRALNSISLLASITSALLDMHVTLNKINTRALGQDHVLVSLNVMCKNIDHYHSIVSRMKSLKDVESVTRGTF